jgi:hypothetical protein
MMAMNMWDDYVFQQEKVGLLIDQELTLLYSPPVTWGRLMKGGRMP